MIYTILGAIIFGVILFFYLFPPISVIGDSMYPTYKDGEVILGTRLYIISNLKNGDVILYKALNSEGQEYVVIKRIFDIKRCGKEYQFYCLGDNSDVSYDSRYYGYISSKQLVCKVVNQRSVKKR